jgi:RNA polymerase-binding transcription factor
MYKTISENTPIQGHIMKKIFLNKIKTILEKEREEILLRAEQHKEAAVDVSGDETDEIQGKIIALAATQLLARDKERLIKINNAFKRISEGTFGMCLDCGESIGEKRLLANPRSVNCISCAEFLELKIKQNIR